MNASGVAPSRLSAARGELQKLPAFVRRDFLTAWSYRLAFFSDIGNLALQAVTFYFVGLMVDPTKIPEFGGSRATYMEFVAIGIVLAAFIQLALGRVAQGLRSEQLMGTMDSLFMTPTSPTTIQLGSVVYDLIYIPLRTGIFLLVITLAFGLRLEPSGIMPAAILLVAFIPFAWGLGIIAAATTLTFRRGGGGVWSGVAVLTLFSGAYFPLSLLPGWLEKLSTYNPIAITIAGMRKALLGGADLTAVMPDILRIAPISLVCFALGAYAFRRAMNRERRQGTFGLY